MGFLLYFVKTLQCLLLVLYKKGVRPVCLLYNLTVFLLFKQMREFPEMLPQMDAAKVIIPFILINFAAFIRKLIK